MNDRLFEAFMCISQINSPSIAEERRNRAEGEKILIKLFDTKDSSISLETVPGGGVELFRR